MGGSLGNSFAWKLGSLELNSLSNALISLTRHKVSLRVVFNCKLTGGSVNFIIFSSSMGKLSSNYRIVFFIYWGWLSYWVIFYVRSVRF